MYQKKGIIASIDYFKLLCAFLVVGIHTEPFSAVPILDQMFGIVTRVAVPFFFVSSAFFFFLKPTAKAGTLKFCKRVFILYAIWGIFYFLGSCIFGGTVATDNVLVFLKSFFLTGYSHLWFLHALIISVAIVALLDTIIKRKTVIYIIAGLLFIIGLFLSTYSNLLGASPAFQSVKTAVSSTIGTRNWLFYGIPFVTLGYYFARRSTALRKSYLMNICGIILSVVLLCGEALFAVKILHTEATIQWLFTIPLLYFVFNLLLSMDMKPIKQQLLIRNASILIYCVHPFFITLFTPIVSNNMVLFLIVALAAAVLSVAIVLLARTRYFKFLRHLM